MSESNRLTAMPTESRGRAPDRRRAPETRARILDAAEALFSRLGYHGVSLRDIAGEAGVQVALSHYHFGSKEELFAAVIDRRADENVRGLEAALAAARRVEGGTDERRAAILRAFILPIVDRSLNHGAGWKNYVRLLARLANLPQEETFLSPYRRHFDEVIADFIAALREADPRMDPDDVHWGVFFLQAAITHIMVESGMLDRQSGGRFRSSDLETIAGKLVPFFAAGFAGFAAARRN